MNELRIALLLVGIAIIAFIYLWEILKRKRNLRARIDSYQATATTGPRIVPLATSPAAEEREMADFNLFLHREEPPASAKPTSAKKYGQDIGPGPAAGEETGSGAGDLAPGASPAREIIVVYIIADKQPYFTGPDILKAMEDVDMHFGDMDIFHNYGPDRKHAKRPLFSLANITEPGYFVMDDMPAFTTRGLALFLCLPAEMGGDIAFEFMMDAAHALAAALGGALRGADRQPLDDDAINKLRVIASLY